MVYVGTIIGVIVVGFLLIVYFRDKFQKSEPVVRHYPVVIWGRKLFIALGPLLRQYLFLDDLQETPYNRITRNWIYQTARGKRNNIGFGTQMDMNEIGSTVFLPATFTNTVARHGDDVGFGIGRVIGGRGSAAPVAMPKFVYISAMSFGALSANAIASLNLGAKKAEIFHNTGEGGLSPYHEQGGGIIFQIGTAKNGVRDKDGKLDDTLLAELAARPHVKMFEIKLAQGAKPGKGGMLLKEKVTPEIAAIRNIPPGTDAYSPPRHAEFSDVEGLFDFIDRVRDVANKPVGIKLVVGRADEIDSIAKKMAEDPNRGPDFITVDGSEGGTGAAPMVLASHAGLPLRQALPTVHSVLKKYGVRENVTVFASGKIATPADVALAMALGADAVGIARGNLLALGCIQSLKCHLGECPTGICTQDKQLQKVIDVEAASDRVATYVTTLMKETQLLSECCGYTDPVQFSPKDVMTLVEPGRWVSLEELTPNINDELHP